MNVEYKNMDLIDLYARAVGRELPEKNRSDIEREIRTLIEDSLEDESQKASRAPDEEMVVGLLERMGSPGKMAASYQPPRYVIGPELYPHFVTTLRVVLTVVTVLAAVGFGFSLGLGENSASNPFELIGQIVSGLLGAVLQATAIVMLIFAAIQHVSPDAARQINSPDWDPRLLREEPDPERVSMPGTIAEIIFTVLALLVFIFYREWIGISTIQNGEWVHIPVLTDAFYRYLPFLVGLWALQIGINIWIMARGSWTTAMRWTSLVHSTLTIVLMAFILAGPAIASLPAESLAQLNWNITPEAAEQIAWTVSLSIRLALGIVIALELVEMGKMLYKLLGRRLPVPVVLGK
jgi:hypothetical protein